MSTNTNIMIYFTLLVCYIKFAHLTTTEKIS